MFENYALPQLNNAISNNILIRQLVGAPVHFVHIVHDYLNVNFPGRWVGRGGPIAWPPRSPDLTPLDVFLWGSVKDQVAAKE
jgi:hypothetical protein